MDDDLVVDRLPDGSREVRLQPVSAAETPFFMKELVPRPPTFEGRVHHS